MPEFMAAILIISILAAGWAFYRAQCIHLHIEMIHPGFNRFMRDLWKRHRRR